MKNILLLALSFLLCFPMLAQKLNQTQIIGSHNSYKSAIAPEILTYLRGMNANTAKGL